MSKIVNRYRKDRRERQYIKQRRSSTFKWHILLIWFSGDYETSFEDPITIFKWESTFFIIKIRTFKFDMLHAVDISVIRYTSRGYIKMFFIMPPLVYISKTVSRSITFLFSFLYRFIEFKSSYFDSTWWETQVCNVWKMSQCQVYIIKNADTYLKILIWPS